jgi:AcrR family transcriptional regulator
VTSGTRLSAGARREQILDVTKRLAASEGFHAVSIEAVARGARISRPIVYEHFGDLRGLLDALVERETMRALGQLREFLPTDLRRGRPRDVLLGALRGYLAAARSDPDTWRLVLMPPEGAPAVLRARIAAGRSAVIAQLTEALGPGLAAPDPELTARMLSALADEAVKLALTDPERYGDDRILRLAEWGLGRLAPA